MAAGVGVNKTYPGQLTVSVISMCAVVSYGGLMFGYDLGIIGGVTSMPGFLQKFFPDVYHKEQSYVPGKNSYCKFNDAKLTLFISSFYLAGFVSSVMASYITRIHGRKRSMLIGGFLFLFGAIINRYAVGVSMLIIGRIFLGFGVGIVNQSSPIYISEMAPHKNRGALNMLFQFCITMGFLCATALNYFTSKTNGWRASFGCAIIPAVLFISQVMCVPDTPNSLLERGKRDEALTNLRLIRGVDDVDEEFGDLVAASIASSQIRDPWSEILKMKYRPHLTFVTCIPIFQQMSGMNVFMFYAPVLYKAVGFGDDVSGMANLMLGMTICLSTLVSIVCVDIYGRRGLFIEGGIQMFICQIVMTICIGIKFGLSGNPGPLTVNYAAVAVAALSVYAAGFAWSWGPLGWLVPSEILPLEIRSVGQSINVSLNMLLTFFISQFFLQGICAMRLFLFIFCTVVMLMMTIFMAKLFPETKGVPIEKMNGIWESQPYWKKCVPLDEDSEMNVIHVNKKMSKWGP